MRFPVIRVSDIASLNASGFSRYVAAFSRQVDGGCLTLQTATVSGRAGIFYSSGFRIIFFDAVFV
ncbi:hypothetical protein EMIT0158MI4_90236 [Burkholderia ambifaria]